MATGGASNVEQYSATGIYNDNVEEKERVLPGVQSIIRGDQNNFQRDQLNIETQIINIGVQRTDGDQPYHENNTKSGYCLLENGLVQDRHEMLNYVGDLSYNLMKVEMIRELSETNIRELKVLLKKDPDLKTGLTAARIKDIQTAEDFLDCLEGVHLLGPYNLIFLPLLLKLVKCEDLVKIVEIYASRKRENNVSPLALCYVTFTSDGIFPAEIKFSGDEQYLTGYTIDQFRERFASHLGISTHNVRFAAAGVGCFIIVFLFPEKVKDDLRLAAKTKAQWLAEVNVIGVHIQGDEYIPLVHVTGDHNINDNHGKQKKSESEHSQVTPSCEDEEEYSEKLNRNTAAVGLCESHGNRLKIMADNKDEQPVEKQPADVDIDHQLHDRLEKQQADVDIDHQLHDRLWEAIIGQNEDMVKECMQKGATASFVKGKDNATLLHIAAKIGNPAILEALLGSECDVSAGEGDIGTALHYAVAGDNKEACQILLKFKANINATDKHGRTALHNACKSERTAICHVLIKEGASVTATDSCDRTALHEVCESGNTEICQLLIDNKASVIALDKRGRTALHLASAGGHIAVCQLLLNAHANAECQDKDERTPLHCASRTNQVDVCRILLDNNAGLETTDKRGRTPLCFAVSTSSEATCEFLISKGANIRQPAGVKMCRARRKALITKEEPQSGTESEKSEIQEPKQTDFSAIQPDGRTLLHIVASCGRSQKSLIIARKLSEIDSSAKDLKGRTAYHIAAGRGCSKLLDQIQSPWFLATDNNERTPLHLAAIHGHIKNCKRLLKSHPDTWANAADKDGNTPLHCASARGHFKICELLIARKNVDVHCKNKNGQTALHLAAARGDRDICKRLVQKGKNPNDLDKNKRTPLHVSAFYNNRGASQSLITAGAQINIKDKDENTPLHSAARNQGDSMCSILIRKKANVLERNKAGESPLDLWPDDSRSTAVSLTTEVKKQVKAELALTGTKQIEIVKLFLLGDPCAGKTTLKKSLSEEVNWDEQFPESSGLRSDEPVADYIPTAGIDIGRQAIGGAGDFCVWDCAGHIEYHVTHNMFLGAENAIFIVAYDLSDARHKHLKKLKYWLSFIKAGHDYSNDSAIPVVQIVATHVDLVDNPREARECAKSTLDLVTKMYQDHLDMRVNLVVVDSREAQSRDMMFLRGRLHAIATEIKGSRTVPVICEEVLKRKEYWCLRPPYNKCPVLNWKAFVLSLRDIKLLADNSTLFAVVRYLHDIGEIYRSKKIHGMYKVVLKPSWLCSTVIGPTFAGRDFPAEMQRLQNKPYFTRSDLTSIFTADVNIDLLIGFLQDLNLAFRYDQDQFVIPARLPEGEAAEKVSWSPDQGFQYQGISLQCVDDTDMFTADVFPSLQVQIMKKFRRKKGSGKQDLKTKIANGIVKFIGKVEGLVELDDQKQAILLAVRCNKKEREKGFSYTSLIEVEDLAQSILKERSPGTRIERRYLSPNDLARQTTLKDVATYDEENIEVAYESDGLVRSDSSSDDLTNVLCHGYDCTFIKQHGWDCDIIWLPRKDQKEVFKYLDKKNDRVEDYRALAEILNSLLKQDASGSDKEDEVENEEGIELDLEEVVDRCRAIKSSKTATIVKEYWPKRSKLPRTLASLYKLLANRGLIGNLEAAKELKEAMEQYGHELSEGMLPSTKCISEFIPAEVQLCRATIRSDWANLHPNIDPRQILRSLDTAHPEILSEEDNEEVEGERSQRKGAKVLLEKLICSSQPHVFDYLHMALNNPEYGVRYLAVGLDRQYKKCRELTSDL